MSYLQRGVTHSLFSQASHAHRYLLSHTPLPPLPEAARPKVSGANPW